MGTNIDSRDLDDPLFAPIFARIEALDLPVFLHPQQTIGGKRLGSFYLNNFLGNPFDTAIAACHLIFGGVLDRHPKLQVNLPHAGGALPVLIGRIDHGWKMRAETKASGAGAEHISAPLHLRHDLALAADHGISSFRRSAPTASMIGSDYCFDMGYERPRQIVDELDLSPDKRAMILGGNAAKLLGI